MKAQVAAFQAETKARKERAIRAAAQERREREETQRWQEGAEAKLRQQVDEMKWIKQSHEEGHGALIRKIASRRKRTTVGPNI